MMFCVSWCKNGRSQSLLDRNIVCSIDWNIFCSFQNDSTLKSTRIRTEITAKEYFLVPLRGCKRSKPRNIPVRRLYYLFFMFRLLFVSNAACRLIFCQSGWSWLARKNKEWRVYLFRFAAVFVQFCGKFSKFLCSKKSKIWYKNE